MTGPSVTSIQASCDISGFLVKHSGLGLTSRWIKRYCVLQGNTIYLFKSAIDEQPTSILQLTTDSTVEHASNVKKSEFCIKLSKCCENNKFLDITVYAANENDFEAWLTALKNAIPKEATEAVTVKEEDNIEKIEKKLSVLEPPIDLPPTPPLENHVLVKDAEEESDAEVEETTKEEPLGSETQEETLSETNEDDAYGSSSSPVTECNVAQDETIIVKSNGENSENLAEPFFEKDQEVSLVKDESQVLSTTSPKIEQNVSNCYKVPALETKMNQLGELMSRLSTLNKEEMAILHDTIRMTYMLLKKEKDTNFPGTTSTNNITTKQN